MGYLCAPGFLMMNGAMVYWAYLRRRNKGANPWRARWDFIERGLFLILVQLVWVNAAWSGFDNIFGSFLDRLSHFGIIATIGSSMILLTFMITWQWWQRLIVAGAIYVTLPIMQSIPYSHDSWVHIPMQLFFTSGDYNKYPILPWFAIATVGSVMAHFWFEKWKDPGERAGNTMTLGLVLVLAGMGLRMLRSYGNTFPFSDFMSYSFFLVQKYPPNTVHNIWFTGAEIFMVGLFDWIGQRAGVLKPLGIVGRVPLFFYCVHIPILAIFTRRIGIYYRQGEVLESFIGLAGLLVVMIPLAIWFGKVKRTTKNHIIKLI